MMSTLNKTGPFLIGGVGGSGTRVFASLLESLGLFMGHNLNDSKDNLSFSKASRFLIENLHLTIDELCLKERPLLIEHDLEFRTYFEKSGKAKWGWKVPGTFYHLPQLFSIYKDKLHYIHIIRNGLDMAFSQNQNQLNNYGHYYNLDINLLPTPVASLRYWIKANQSAIKTAKTILKNQFLLIKFEDLCESPQKQIKLLSDFCGVKISNDEVKSMLSLIKPPSTIGRYKKQDLSIFTSSEIKSVQNLGFSTSK